MRPLITLIIAGACLAATGATACGSDGGRDGSAGSTSTVAATATATASRIATSSVSRAMRAVRTAKKEVRRGRPYDLETERYRGDSVWEIKVAKGTRRPYEFAVSANGRTILRRSRASHLGDDAPRARRAKVSLAKALRIAEQRTSGRLDEAEIDRNRAGTIVWTVTFERANDAESEVVIDARTGEVIRIVADDD